MISRTTISLAAVLVWVGCAHHIRCDTPTTVSTTTSIVWHIRNFNMFHSWWKVLSARYSVSKANGPHFFTSSISIWETIHIHCHRGRSGRTWESHQRKVIISSISIVVWILNNLTGTNDLWSLSSQKEYKNNKDKFKVSQNRTTQAKRIPLNTKLQSSYLPAVSIRHPSVRVMTNSPNFGTIEDRVYHAMSSCQNKLKRYVSKWCWKRGESRVLTISSSESTASQLKAIVVLPVDWPVHRHILPIRYLLLT